MVACEQKQDGGEDEKKATPMLTVKPESIDVTAAAGNYSITVTSNTAWTATNNRTTPSAAPGIRLGALSNESSLDLRNKN
jgi:hypothetical protein